MVAAVTVANKEEAAQEVVVRAVVQLVVHWADVVATAAGSEAQVGAEEDLEAKEKRAAEEGLARLSPSARARGQRLHLQLVRGLVTALLGPIR